MAQVKSSYLVLAVVLVVSSSVFGAKGNRSYVSGSPFLTIDGVKCGFLKSVEGGGITAEVIREPQNSGYFVKKHIGQPQYEDFQVQVGLSLSGKVYEWIAQSWSMARPRVSGSITVLDYDLQPASERQFFNALLTETTIPAMDGASKEPAYITLKFAPEYTRAEKPSGGKADYGQYGKNEQKVWLPANFKLEIAGLDCSKVSRIESFTVKQMVVTDDIGSARDVAQKPGKLEFPNLKITLAEATASSWLDWHESFVLKGNNDEASEKGGSLTFFSANLKDVLAQIKFYNMGIIRAQPEKSEANADTIKRVQVELYVERMEFVPGSKGIASGSAETPDGGATSTPATTSPTPAQTLLPSAPKTLKRAG